MARYIFMRYGFLMSCSFVWFAFMALPYLIAAVIVHLIPLDLGVVIRWEDRIYSHCRL